MRKKAEFKMEIQPRPELLSSQDECCPSRASHQGVSLSDLWQTAMMPSRRLEALVWKRFAEAAGCPEALTEEDRRWLEAS